MTWQSSVNGCELVAAVCYSGSHIKQKLREISKVLVGLPPV